MVVTKVTSEGTFNKRQRLNSPTKPCDDSLLDLTTEEEAREGEDVLSLFSSRSSSLFRSYFRAREKDYFPSSSSSSDHQAEVSGTDRLLNENERDLGDTQSEETQIGVSGARGWLGKHRSQSVSLRFTPEWIEVQADDLDDYIFLQWPLEEIHLLEFYYKCEDAYLEDEESAIISFKFHKSKGFLHGECSENVCFDMNDSYILEISRWEWVSQEQRILALSARYGDILQQLTSKQRVMGYKEKLLQSIPQEVTDCVSRFTQSIQAFEVLTFPQNDPDAVTITQKDIQRLKPKEFLNDTIIDFYIKFLQSKLTAKNKERFYFFNSFFFSKLADDDMMHGKAAFARVKKWTRKVKVFDKDYVVIPVNQSLHWSLIIICHPGNIGGLSKTNGFCVGTPCILHLDSMKGSHLDAGEIIRNYLLEEWFERSHQTHLSMEQTEALFSQLQCICAQVPQQDNLWDCGLFLLHYVDLFLKAAPVEFSLARSQGFPYFLTESWFKPSEASGKRADIKGLILELSGDSPSVEKPGSETSNYSQSAPLTTGMEIVALSDCQPCASDPLLQKSPLAEGSFDIKEENEVGGATLTLEVCHFPEECEVLNNVEDIQNHSSVAEDLSSEIAIYQPTLGNNVILLMEEDDCAQQGDASWDVLDFPVLSPVRPLQVPGVLDDPMNMDDAASDISAYVSVVPTSIFNACKVSNESMHYCSIEAERTYQRRQKALISLTRLGEGLFHNLSNETMLLDMSSNFELENRPANSRVKNCIVEKPLEMFGGQRLEAFGVSASIQDIEELSSDDSLDEWERSRARRSQKIAPQIGKRITRSKTQKPSLDVKEEARQAALSLCKEKAKKQLK